MAVIAVGAQTIFYYALALPWGPLMLKLPPLTLFTIALYSAMSILVVMAGGGFINLRAWSRQTLVVFGWFGVGQGVLMLISTLKMVGRFKSPLYFAGWIVLCLAWMGVFYLFVRFLKSPKVRQLMVY
jgi:hypothetical protein